MKATSKPTNDHAAPPNTSARDGVEDALIRGAGLVSLALWVERARTALDRLNEAAASDTELARMLAHRVVGLVEWGEEESDGLYALNLQVLDSIGSAMDRAGLATAGAGATPRH